MQEHCRSVDIRLSARCLSAQSGHPAGQFLEAGKQVLARSGQAVEHTCSSYHNAQRPLRPWRPIQLCRKSSGVVEAGSALQVGTWKVCTSCGLRRATTCADRTKAQEFEAVRHKSIAWGAEQHPLLGDPLSCCLRRRQARSHSTLLSITTCRASTDLRG